MMSYKRMVEAIETFTSHAYYENANQRSVQALVCRLLPHSKKPPKAFWDKGADVPDDPRYLATNFGWDRTIEAPSYDDIRVNPGENEIQLSRHEENTIFFDLEVCVYMFVYIYVCVCVCLRA
jgi:hypothetical protein